MLAAASIVSSDSLIRVVTGSTDLIADWSRAGFGAFDSNIAGFVYFEGFGWIAAALFERIALDFLACPGDFSSVVEEAGSKFKGSACLKDSTGWYQSVNFLPCFNQGLMCLAN